MMTKSFTNALVAALAITALLTGCIPYGDSDSSSLSGQQTATQSLLAQAQTAMDENNFHQAEMYIERAVRIEPRNPRLWHTMAMIKLQQGQYGEVVNFCLKSNSLVADNAQLKKENLLLMALAYHQMGEYDKAEAVERQAAEIENFR